MSKKRPLPQPAVDEDVVDEVSSIIRSPNLSRLGLKMIRSKFNSLEIESVRKSVLPLIKLDSWHVLCPQYREHLFKTHGGKLEVLYKKSMKNFDSNEKNLKFFQSTFLSSVIQKLLASVEGLARPTSEAMDESESDVLIEGMLLLIDLLSQLPTRRTVRALLVDSLFPERTICLSNAATAASSTTSPLLLLLPYMDRVVELMEYSLNEFSAEMLTPIEQEEVVESVRSGARAVCWRHGLHELGLSASSVLFGSGEKIRLFLTQISQEIVQEIVKSVFLVDVSRFENRPDLIPAMFQYRLTDHHSLARAAISSSVGEKEISRLHKVEDRKNLLPKLGVQYLSLHDYCMRNHALLRIEAAHAVQSAITNSVPRLSPEWSDKVGRFVFPGSARTALGVEKFDITEVTRGGLTSTAPSSVVVTATVSIRQLILPVREEWDKLRKGDSLCLVEVARISPDESSLNELSVCEGCVIRRVRQCELMDITDIQGNSAFAVTPGVQKSADNLIGDKRTFTLSMDPVQYEADLHAEADMGLVGHVLVRMENFHVKSLLGFLENPEKVKLPEWIHDVLLGYGEPTSVRPDGPEEGIGEVLMDDDAVEVRVTKEQEEAVHAGMRRGLTLVTGVGGSGKSTVVSGIVSALAQRNGKILLVAKSNECLNALLGKLRLPREYILKPGGSSDDPFSRNSVINHILQSRVERLAQVKQLAVMLGHEKFAADYAFSCETANQFWVNHVQPLWARYTSLCRSMASATEEEKVRKLEQLVKDGEVSTGTNKEGQFEDVVNPFKSIPSGYEGVKAVFAKLEEIRPFEIFRSVADRSQFVLSKLARVVGVTSTGLAIHRESLLAQNFTTVVIDDASQMLDAECMLALANGRLERVVMAGDLDQLPPVVTNPDLAPLMSQTMLSRLVKLGCPTVVLSAQLRWNPSVTPPAGLMHASQFVDVSDPQGESQPMTHMHQNISEAEFAVALFMYLRLSGNPRTAITILTSYNGQRLLVNDVVKARCASNPLFGEPACVTTIDQYQGQENEIVIVSLVRTESLGHNAHARRLVAAASRAKCGVYFLGKLELYTAPTAPGEVQRFAKGMMTHGSKLALANASAQPVVVENLDHMWSIIQATINEQMKRY